MSHTALIDLCRDLMKELSPNSGVLSQSEGDNGTRLIEIKGLSINKGDKVVHGLNLRLTFGNLPHLSITHKGKILLEMDKWRDITDPIRDPRFKHILRACLLKAFDKSKDKDKLQVGQYVSVEGIKKAEMAQRIAKVHLSNKG